ncbi:MAG: tRNA modification GTPase [Planctomycetota bacterium]|nr:MAG: tRNA modification GTPase [Planctomycetota bacterium]
MEGTSLGMEDLIAAVATPPGTAARSVIRLSGASVVELLRQRFQPAAALSHLKRAHRIVGQYTLEGWRGPVPVDLWVWPTQRSYTGQPSAEIQMIGSPQIVDAVLTQCYRDGARPARAGEFTLRAFLAGRVDLFQAEAVLGVIDATDHEQLHAALSQLAGGLSHRITQVRESLLLHLADLEAGLDFVEEDIEFVQRPLLMARIREVRTLVEELWQQGTARMAGGGLPQVVLAGLPNAGKSTLFNRLGGAQRAIVSAVAGTTRDVLSVEMSSGKFRWTLLDTAGLDESSSGIAAAAEALRREQVASADLVLWCSSLMLSEADAAIDDLAWKQLENAPHAALRIYTQADRAGPQPLPTGQVVSAETGEGLGGLRAMIEDHFQRRAAHHGEWLASTAARSHDALERCVHALRSAESAAANQLGDELLSMELRAALDALGEVCGAVHTDDILDRIFSRFCIGK